MGMCQPSGGISPPIIGNSMPKKGEPANSRRDLKDLLGNLIRTRWYGPDGRAIRDRDFTHIDEDTLKDHPFPHDHRYDWSKRNPHQDWEAPDYENFCTEC